MSSHITKYVDILLLSETKLDDSFPTAQFSLNGFCKPYRLDRSSNGGGILLYVRDDIPSQLLTDYEIKYHVQLFFVNVTVMKTHYKKQKAKTIQYRNYKSFHEQSFNFELNIELLKIDINYVELKEFNEFFLKVIDKHAPRKQNRANNSNYITEALRKEIMDKS